MDDDEFQRAVRHLMGRQPRWRYFAGRNGAMYFWATERDETNSFASGVYRPYGKGSRSGRAEHWELDEDLLSHHELRRDAKARALRLLEEEQQ